MVKVREVLLERDRLKNNLYAIKRSIVLSEIYLKDEEVIENLMEMKVELEQAMDELTKSLETIEDMEM